jgi:hypothetical protein
MVLRKNPSPTKLNRPLMESSMQPFTDCNSGNRRFRAGLGNLHRTLSGVSA